MPLKALVHERGFVGQGHAEAFRQIRYRDCGNGWDVADDTLRSWIILAKQLMGDVEGKYVGT